MVVLYKFILKDIKFVMLDLERNPTGKPINRWKNAVQFRGRTDRQKISGLARSQKERGGYKEVDRTGEAHVKP